MEKFRILRCHFDRRFLNGKKPMSFSRNLVKFPAWLAWSSNFPPESIIRQSIYPLHLITDFLRGSWTQRTKRRMWRPFCLGKLFNILYIVFSLFLASIASIMFPCRIPLLSLLSHHYCICFVLCSILGFIKFLNARSFLNISLLLKLRLSSDQVGSEYDDRLDKKKGSTSG